MTPGGGAVDDIYVWGGGVRRGRKPRRCHLLLPPRRSAANWTVDIFGRNTKGMAWQSRGKGRTDSNPSKGRAGHTSRRGSNRGAGGLRSGGAEGRHPQGQPGSGAGRDWNTAIPAHMDHMARPCETATERNGVIQVPATPLVWGGEGGESLRSQPARPGGGRGRGDAGPHGPQWGWGDGEGGGLERIVLGSHCPWGRGEAWAATHLPYVQSQPVSPTRMAHWFRKNASPKFV